VIQAVLPGVGLQAPPVMLGDHIRVVDVDDIHRVDAVEKVMHDPLGFLPHLRVVQVAGPDSGVPQAVVIQPRSPIPRSIRARSAATSDRRDAGAGAGGRSMTSPVSPSTVAPSSSGV